MTSVEDSKYYDPYYGREVTRPLDQSHQMPVRLPQNVALPFQVHSGEALIEDQRRYRNTSKYFDSLDTFKLGKEEVRPHEKDPIEKKLSKVDTDFYVYRGEGLSKDPNAFPDTQFKKKWPPEDYDASAVDESMRQSKFGPPKGEDCTLCQDIREGKAKVSFEQLPNGAYQHNYIRMDPSTNQVINKITETSFDPNVQWGGNTSAQLNHIVVGNGQNGQRILKKEDEYVPTGKYANLRYGRPQEGDQAKIKATVETTITNPMFHQDQIAMYDKYKQMNTEFVDQNPLAAMAKSEE